MALWDGRLVVNFIAQALRGEPLTVYGDGSQTRSLCYVDDLLDGIEALMALETDPGPVNLGNPVEMSVLEVTQRVLDLLPGTTIEHHPLPIDDPKRRRPDITRAEGLFGFSPTVGLATGLERTIDDVAARLRLESGEAS